MFKMRFATFILNGSMKFASNENTTSVSRLVSAYNSQNRNVAAHRPTREVALKMTDMKLQDMKSPD